MFESIVAHVLNRLLGRYISNLEQNQLKLSIFSGQVALRGLRLKKESLAELKLPIEVLEGYLGELNLVIPWASLKTQPVIIEIKDLFVLAGPKTESLYDFEAERETAYLAKLEKIETYEMFKSSKMQIEETSASGDGFVSHLVTKIIDNLQITVKNIHIRYEDKQSNAERAFALGVVLSELSAISTDENWQAVFLADAVDRIHKLATLDDLVIYWQSGAPSIYSTDIQVFCHNFRAIFEGEDSYLLKPVSGIGRAILHKKIPDDTPRTTLNLLFESFDFCINAEQYYDALKLFQSFVLARRSLKYRFLRPKELVTPRQKFLFSIQCFIQNFRSKALPYTQKSLLKACKMRRDYIRLFKLSQLGKASLEELAEIDEIQRQASFQQLRLFRALARRELHSERLIEAKLPPPKPKGWFGGWFSSAVLQEEAQEIKDEEVKALYDTIDYDESEEEVLISDLPATTQLFSIGFELAMGSFKLIDKTEELAQLSFLGLSSSLLKRPKSVRFEIELMDLLLLENIVPSSLYKTLVKPKTIESVADSPLFSLCFDKMPKNPDAEYEIHLKMLPLEIVFSAQAYTLLMTFLTSGRNKTAFGSLATETETKISELASKTRAGLEEAIKRHKAVDWFIDIDAPIVIFPRDVQTMSSYAFILDLGSFSMRSLLISRKEREFFKEKLTASVDSSLLEVPSDRIDGKLSHASLYWKHKFLAECEEVIEPIDMQLSIKNTIVKIPGVTPVRIKARVHRIAIHFTDERYHTLIDLFDYFFPDDPSKHLPRLKRLPKTHLGSNISLSDLIPRLGRIAVDEETGETFQDALGEDKDAANIESQNWEFVLMVDESSMTVDSVSYGGHVGLVQAERFHLYIFDYPFDMLIKVTLHAFSIRDLMQGKDFCFAHEESGISESLLSVTTRLVQFKHPHFESQYKGCRYHVDIELASLLLFLDGESLFTIIRFVRETFASGNKIEEPGLSRTESFMDLLLEDKEQGKSTPIITRITLTKLTVGLGRDPNYNANLVFKKAAATFLYTPDELLPEEGPYSQIEVHGQLMEALILDSKSTDPIPFMEIQGEERLEFWYSSGALNLSGHDYGSQLRLLLGSPRFNYRPDLLWQISNWWQHFKHCTPLMDVKSPESSEVSRFQLSVEISSPIIDIRSFGVSNERISFYLGRINAANTIGKVEDTTGRIIPGTELDQVWEINLDDIRTTCQLDESEEMQLLENAQIQMRVVQVQNAVARVYANTEMIGHFVNSGPVSLSVNRQQYTFFMDRVLFMSSTIADATRPITTPLGDQPFVSTNPEELSVEVFFNIPSLHVTLIEDDGPMTRVVLQPLGLHVTMRPDGEMITEAAVGALSMHDMRSGTSVRFIDFIVPPREFSGREFRFESILKPIPEFPPFPAQLKAHYERRANGSGVADVTLLRPKAVMVLNYLFTVKSFLIDSYPTQEKFYEEASRLHKLISSSSATFFEKPDYDNSEDKLSQKTELEMEKPQSGQLFIQAVIKDFNAFILENPQNEATEALHVIIPIITLLSQNPNNNVCIENLSASFCNMDAIEATQIECLSPLTIDMHVDTSRSVLNVSPLALCFSYQDVEMLMSIYRQFMSLNQSSPHSNTNVQIQNTQLDYTSNYSIESMQLTLIDDTSDIHLPFIEVLFKNASLETISRVGAGSQTKGIIGLSINHFNLNSSHWEPFLESCSLQLDSTVSVMGHVETMVNSIRPLEFTTSHTFLQDAFQKYRSSVDRPPRVPTAARAVAKPYVIKNLTGYQISVWPESRTATAPILLSHGEFVSWSFQDWRDIRKYSRTSDASTAGNKLAIHLTGSPWESVRRIAIDRPGLTIYPLRPRIENVSHKLACHVQLQPDNIKLVYLRSTCLFSNRTGFTVDVMDVDGEATKGLQTGIMTPPPLACYSIGPDSIGALAIQHSHRGTFRLRPTGLGYAWSEEFVHIEKLIRKTLLTGNNKLTTSSYGMIVTCKSLEPEIAPFRFLLSCKAESTHHSEEYPIVTIYIRTMFAIWNMLPYGVRFQILDRAGPFEISGVIPVGDSAPLQAINYDDEVELRVEIPEADLRSPSFICINSRRFDFGVQALSLVDSARRDSHVLVSCKSFTGGLRRVFIHSPYVILNKTEMQLEFKSGAIGFNAHLTAGFNEPGKPLLLCPNVSGSSLGNDAFRNGKIRLRTPVTKWSEVINLDVVSTYHHIDLMEETTKTPLNFVLTSRIGDDRFSMSKVVLLSPRYMLANNTSYYLWVVGEHGGMVLEVEAGQSSAFHMMPVSEYIAQQFRISTRVVNWSVPIAIIPSSKTHAKIQLEDGRTVLLRVQITQREAISWIVIEEENIWPIQIRNHSSFDVLYHQHECRGEYGAKKGESINFAWDEPSKRIRRLVISCYGRSRELDLNQIGRAGKVLSFKTPSDNRHHLLLEVSVEGPVRVVTILDHIRRRIITQYPGKKASIGSEQQIDLNEDEINDKEVESAAEAVLWSLTLRLPGFGLSLVNRNVREILYASAKNVEIRYTLTDSLTTYGLALSWFQIDNQSLEWHHPIVMFPSTIRRIRPSSPSGEHHFLRAALLVNRDETHGLRHIVYAGLLLQEMNVELGDDVVKAVLDMFRFESIRAPKSTLFRPEELEHLALGSSFLDASAPIYFENLQIHPIIINFTFTKTELGFGEDKSAGGYNPLGALINILTLTMGNVSDASLRFNLLYQEHGILTPQTLCSLVYDHYTSQAIGQLYKLVGAADFIGNPAGLISSFSSGIQDLFYEPWQGIVSDRPQDIGIGLVKGGYSLIRKTVYGLTDTVSKVTDTMGKGFSSLSFDQEYLNRRRMQQVRNKPKHAFAGVGLGAKALIEGISGGLTGLIEQPLEGAQREGAKGFFKGVGKAFTGVVVKPVTGVFDLVTNTVQGIRNSADADFGEVTQVRPPRVIPHDGILQEYSEYAARGQLALYQILGTALYVELYLGHLQCGPEWTCFLTLNRIIMWRDSRHHWQIPFSDLHSFRSTPSGILLVARLGDPRNRLIPLEDQAWLLKRIEETLALYQEAHRPSD